MLVIRLLSIVLAPGLSFYIEIESLKPTLLCLWLAPCQILFIQALEEAWKTAEKSAWYSQYYHSINDSLSPASTYFWHFQDSIIMPIRSASTSSSEIWVPALKGPLSNLQSISKALCHPQISEPQRAPPLFLVTPTSFYCYHISGRYFLQLSPLDYPRILCLLVQPPNTCGTNALY